MPSYKAGGKVTYYTNKTENTYTFEEYYDGKDCHLIRYTEDELKVYVNKNGVYSAYNNDKAVRISDTDEGYKYIFPDCFFESYYTKETSSVDKDSKYVILESDYFSDNVSLVRMWIDTDSVNPYMMQIYDDNDKLLLKILFTSFEYGYKTEDEIFSFQ